MQGKKKKIKIFFGNENKELKVYSTSLYSVDFQLHIEVWYLYVIIIYHKLIIDKWISGSSQTIMLM